MKYVLLYESADDVLSKAPAHFPAHQARLQEFHARGDILMVGTFGDPQEQGSMAIFPTRAAAEAFVDGDPFVLNGVVRGWEIREWNEVLAPDVSLRPAAWRAERRAPRGSAAREGSSSAAPRRGSPRAAAAWSPAISSRWARTASRRWWRGHALVGVERREQLEPGARTVDHRHATAWLRVTIGFGATRASSS